MNETEQQLSVKLRSRSDAIIRDIIGKRSTTIQPLIDILIYSIVTRYTGHLSPKKIKAGIVDALTFENNSDIDLSIWSVLEETVNKDAFSRMAYIELLNTHYFVPVTPPDSYSIPIVSLSTTSHTTDHKWLSFFKSGIPSIIDNVNKQCLSIAVGLAEIALEDYNCQVTGVCNLITEEIAKFQPYLTTAHAVDQINKYMENWKLSIKYISSETGNVYSDSLQVVLLP